MGKKKLNAKKVREIRESSDSRAELAERYDVSTSTIRQIQHGLKWKSAGGPIRGRSAQGVMWSPSPKDIEIAVKALHVRGVWSDAANAVGVALATFKKCLGDNEQISAAQVAGLRLVEDVDRAKLTEAIAARRVSKSWGAAAAACGLTTSALGSLRAKYTDTAEECRAASEAGREFTDRAHIVAVLSELQIHKSWSRASASLGLSAMKIHRIRRLYPDLNAELEKARGEFVGWLSRGFLYAIQDGHGFVKIGRTTNIKDRRNQLRAGNPSGSLTVLFCEEVDNVGDVEREIHDRLANHRTGGEWFNVTAELAIETARAVVNSTTTRNQ